MEELIMQLISESVTIAIIFYGWNKDARRLDLLQEKMMDLIPTRGEVVLPNDQLKPVNPENAKNYAELAVSAS